MCLLTTTACAQVTAPSAASVAPAARQVAAPVQAAPLPAVDGAPDATASWKLIRLIKLPNPGAASLDRRGALYVADADNNLRQYGPEGLLLNTYAPAQPGHVAQVEAWNVTTTLVFNDDRQQLVLLDRFLTLITEMRLADFLDGTVRVATLAPDNRIWLLDESNLVLREFDPNTRLVIQNTPLDLIIGRARPDFRFLRQYQNNTYLVDRNTGIYVFDNLGTYRKKMPIAGLSMVGFRGDEMYYFADEALHFAHLYNQTERRVALPAAVPAAEVRQVLVGEGFAYIFTAVGVTVYQYN
ncbi:hypothetical protein BEN47_13675 [Hymenobacter lapidarius]|uniref:SMP-30/Gluconolactonase/LRE-like region domain-containing protein n=1 Tax=Hymenobacter lapidarius TaxID=1908237 RepID=A0A1G1T570_9BACT|nr:hypothetical protein [Hymenobacter lapidarius]OGX86021.1 hypothetical protein BEN47_13675 [Hymenobacter lapidarius]